MPITTPPRAKVRRQRRHGDLPAGFKWRDGRPRWEPSPSRRKQGWRGRDLKDAWGMWLAKGPAIARAEAIAAAVVAWASGVAVPSAMVAIAPRGSDLAGAAAADLNPRSIGAMFDAYYADLNFRSKAHSTQGDYRSKHNRLLDVLACADGVALIKIGETRRAEVRGLDMDILLPPGFGEAGDFELERAYDVLREQAGEHMAAGVLAAASAWLGWCVKKKRLWPNNPALLVERMALDGRIVVYEWPEIVALVREAEKRGLYSIADAIVLGVDLSWSRQDLLALQWSQVSADHHVKHRRIKTGIAGNPPLLAIGRARIEAIRRRWQGSKVRPLHVLVCELTGNPWSGDTFTRYFAEIRAAVAVDYPAVADRQFRDLRDTAVTYCNDAGLDVTKICSRTLHAPARAAAVLAKHYGAVGQSIADEAGEILDAHFKRAGYSFDDLLALPAPTP